MKQHSLVSLLCDAGFAIPITGLNRPWLKSTAAWILRKKHKASKVERVALTAILERLEESPK